MFSRKTVHIIESFHVDPRFIQNNAHLVSSPGTPPAHKLFLIDSMLEALDDLNASVYTLKTDLHTLRINLTPKKEEA